MIKIGSGLLPAPLTGPDFSATYTEHDAIVRFVDVDVMPGKTYRYQIQVRMANPNFGKKSDVAFQALADVKEILSPWTPTPEVKIPAEYHFNNVDQLALDKASEKIALKDQAPKDAIPMQIHRWFTIADDRHGVGYNRNDIGDWGVLERSFVRRGDFIGQNNALLLAHKLFEAHELEWALSEFLGVPNRESKFAELEQAAGYFGASADALLAWP